MRHFINHKKVKDAQKREVLKRLHEIVSGVETPEPFEEGDLEQMIRSASIATEQKTPPVL
jgi:hypothetical protein